MIVYPFSFIKSADVALSNYVAPLLDLTNASFGFFTDFGNPVDESKYLNVSNGSWLGSPTSFNYQWFRNSSATFSGGVTISGYTSATYSLRWVDVGQYVYCQVTAIKGAASVIAGSCVLRSLVRIANSVSHGAVIGCARPPIRLIMG